MPLCRSRGNHDFQIMAMASLPSRLIDFIKIQCVFLSIICIGLSCMAEVNVGGEFGEVFGRLDNKQREFDYFKLAVQWPGTACRDTRRCCSSNVCCRRSNAMTEFTIHGLWPDYNDGTWPACCAGKRFDIKEISTLLGVLNKYWPSLSCDYTSNCHGGKGLFWEHEWEKHGTCSFPVIRDEYDYFVTALSVYFKYNVTEVLREAGYVASNTEKYPLGGIISAIQNAFHATPELQCSGDAVEELRLCFYKDFKIHDCAVGSDAGSGMISSKMSCPRYISLPEFVSLRLENNETETSQSTLRSTM